MQLENWIKGLKHLQLASSAKDARRSHCEQDKRDTEFMPGRCQEKRSIKASEVDTFFYLITKKRKRKIKSKKW